MTTRHRNDGLRKRCACPRTRWSKCRHSWYLAYQWRGKRYRLCLDRLIGRPLKGKTEADVEADRIRGEIRAETFQNATTPPPADSRVRVTELGALFVERTAKARGKVTWRDDEAKTRKLRHIPIVARLRAVLEMGRHDPAGHLIGPDGYVFGDEVGRRLTSQQKAWETAVLKAHGHSPSWVRHGLTPESREAYRTIDLQFRDLRHEAGSRWLEQGLPLHHVKELLGHASISTTDTYLNASRIHLQESMLEMEQRGKSGTNVAQNDGRKPGVGVRDQNENTVKLLEH